MKKIYIITLLTVFCFINNLYSENYRVYLRDKGPEEFTKDSELYQTTLKSISGYAIERRAKILHADSLISIADAPIYEPYLIAIESIGARVLHTLKWLNYCIIYADSSLAEEISRLDFILKVEPASSKFTLMKINEDSMNHKSNEFDILEVIKIDNTPKGKLEYGLSFTQIKLINADKIHELGIFGENVKIGFLDSGFDYSKAKAFEGIDVAAQWDFINNNDVTANEPGEHHNQFHHGTLVMSLVAGFDSPKFIGMSPGSRFFLAKTEDIGSERQIETDYFAAGIEWLESHGVDIINASLGYNAFDSTDASYTFDDLDGQTTIPSIYVNLAAQRGVIFVTSAGNGGPDDKTINSPADADSVIAVGSVMPNGTESSRFSARGPNAKNKIKPDITTIGENVFCVNPTSATDYISSKGTSLSSPLIAGAFGLMLSAFPEIKPYTAKSLLLQSGNRYNEPDNTFGYGIPDLLEAMLNYDIIISPYSTYQSNRYQRIFFKAISDSPIQSVKLYASFDDNQHFVSYDVKPTMVANQYVCDIPLNMANSGVISFYIEVKTETRKRRSPYNENQFFWIKPGDSKFAKNFEQRDEPRFIDAVTSFIYPNLVYSGTSHIKANIFVEQKGNVKLRLFDRTGKLFFESILHNAIPGIEEYLINILELQSGAYFLLITHSGKSEVVPFIIVK